MICSRSTRCITSLTEVTGVAGLSERPTRIRFKVMVLLGSLAFLTYFALEAARELKKGG